MCQKYPAAAEMMRTIRMVGRRVMQLPPLSFATAVPAAIRQRFSTIGFVEFFQRLIDWLEAARLCFVAILAQSPPLEHEVGMGCTNRRAEAPHILGLID